ncbi:hypothetical protein HK405_013655, partial [Cladochytrium tenue]
MTEFYHSIPPGDERPKVFGMTASPIYQKTTTRDSSTAKLNELQQILNCKVITVSDRKSVESFVSKAVETIVEYDEYLPSSSPAPEQSPSVKFCSFYENQLADIHETLSKQEGANQKADECKRYLEQVKQVKAELGYWCAGKLASRGAKGFRGMVFAEKRAAAMVLHELFEILAPVLFPTIHTGFITGQNISNGHQKMTAVNQKRILDQFRHGYLNLLFVTNVAEEGIDIPACKLVIIFDRFRSNTGYVQSRGRARDIEGAEYIIMIKREDIYALDVVVQAKVAEVLTRSVAGSLSQSFEVDNASNSSTRTVVRGSGDNNIVDTLVGFNDVYQTDLAIATLSHAESILMRYCKGKPQFESVLELNISKEQESGFDHYKKTRNIQLEKVSMMLGISMEKIEDAALPIGFAYAVLLKTQEPPFDKIYGA